MFMGSINKAQNDDFQEIDTGNGKSANLVATTNDRLRQTVIELRNVGVSLTELDSGIKNFHKDSDTWSNRLVNFTVILIALTIMLIFLTVDLIYEGHKEISSQNNIALNTEFFNPTNTNIIGNIENNQPILIENKGEFTDAQLNNYLEEFESVDDVYNEGLLSQADMCDSFSYYVQITDKNKEIQNYIQGQQKSDFRFFTGYQELSKVVANSKNKNCK
jgi:hypothetical protein